MPFVKIKFSVTNCETRSTLHDRKRTKQMRHTKQPQRQNNKETKQLDAQRRTTKT